MGRPLQMVSMAVRLPYMRPVLPREISAMSGFFFCGMRLEPVQKASESSMNWNSCDIQRIISSERREMCMEKIARAESSSHAKSRSATESMLLRVQAGKSRTLRTNSRSMGRVEPASAPEPSGMTLRRVRQSVRRPISRSNCSMYASM